MKKENFLHLMLVGLLIISPFAMAEPTNIAIHKQELKQYHDSGRYFKEVNIAIDDGMRYLKEYIAQSSPGDKKKPAIVLDIDETSLSNYQDMVKLDFGGTMEQIQAAEDKGEDPPIESTLKLYRFAKAHHVAVFFLTGRLESERAMTEANLKKAGYANWDGLILRAGVYQKAPATVYKTAIRKKITEQGYDIILNIGDQQSDLAGRYASKLIKLPNPYYFIA